MIHDPSTKNPWYNTDTIFIKFYAAVFLYSSIDGQEQNKFLSPYTLSTLATGGQYLNVFKNSDGYAASSLSYL